MNKKKTLILLTSAVSAFAIATGSLVATNTEDVLTRAAEHDFYSITITADNLLHDYAENEYVSGTTVIYTDQLKNPILISFSDVKKQTVNDKLVLTLAPASGVIYNNHYSDNEIRSMEYINLKSEGEYPEDEKLLSIHYSWLLGDYYCNKIVSEKEDHISSGMSYDFEGDKPSYFSVEAFNDDYAVSLSAITLIYPTECKASINPHAVHNINDCSTTKVGEYNTTSFYKFLAEAGQPLENLSLVGLRFISDDEMGWHTITDNSQISGLSIEYVNADSDTVIIGDNDVVISFVFGGIRYNSSSLTLMGYDHYELRDPYPHLENSQIHVKDSDELPKDFAFMYDGTIYFLDSDDSTIDSGHAYKIVEITSDMITKIDDHPFTSLGKHSINLEYLGESIFLQYTVYDPDVCNIRGIGTSVLKADYGITNDQFLNYVATLNTNVFYYESRPDQPSEISMSLLEYHLSDNMFSDFYEFALVDFSYQGYDGQLYVNLTLNEGTHVETYSNTDGVVIFGQSVNSIELFNNGVCKLTSTSSDILVLYRLEDNVLTVTRDGFTAKLDLDNDNKTFVAHVSTATKLFDIKVDFSSLGAPELYDATFYDDNHFEISMFGQVMPLNYEFQNVEQTIVYFEFAVYNLCQGVIDYDQGVMVVTQIQE